MKTNQLVGYGFTSDLDLIRKHEIKKEESFFTIKIAAQIINKNGFGRNKLYELLRTLEYIEPNNFAKQKYVDEGSFINFLTYRDLGGIHGNTNQVLLTIKGLNLVKELVRNQVK